jgi:hypothetical protein
MTEPWFYGEQFEYDGPSEDQVMDWNIHNDHADEDYGTYREV